MNVITEAKETVIKILGKSTPSEFGYRLFKYCVQTQVDEGILLCNLLTEELLLLTEEEYENWLEIDYLKEHWFVVPEIFDDKKCVDTVRWVKQTITKKTMNITGYTILTTTDCNARCFYCFEKGHARVSMSEETALKTVQYIKNHCGGEKVSIRWFGGEPLFNLPVIDLICRELQREGIEYRSKMFSNGYLFDDVSVEKAVESWNLTAVQITLDGTEDVYNKSKAYIYKDTNPYAVVLGNIERLLNAGISVQIRLNLDLYNAENLLNLIDELAERFQGKKRLYIYAHHLFDANLPMAHSHSDKEWDLRYEAMHKLEEKISGYGLLIRRGVRKGLGLNHCMADSDNSVVIAPTGHIGVCEHHTEDEFIGHIDSEEIDEKVIDSWKEREPEIPECADCFYYPACVRIKKCTVNTVCFRHIREENLRLTQYAMRQDYASWSKKTDTKDVEGAELC